ncbi:MAG: hypothetical protein ACP5J5_06700 [Dissulfurimicrobium sp.]
MRLPPRTIFDIKQFDKDMNAFEGRYKRCTLLLLLVFMILISRLWYLQIYKGDELRAKSESNRLRVLRIQAPRGRVFDRNGRILTGV